MFLLLFCVFAQSSKYCLRPICLCVFVTSRPPFGALAVPAKVMQRDSELRFLPSGGLKDGLYTIKLEGGAPCKGMY